MDEKKQDVANINLVLRNLILHTCEEVRFLRMNKRENEDRMQQLVTEQHKQERQLEEEVLKNNTLKDKHNQEQSELQRSFEDKIHALQREKSKLLWENECWEKEVKVVKDEVRTLQLDKYNLERMVREQSHCLQMQAVTRTAHLKQVNDLQERCKEVTQLADSCKTQLNSLSKGVKEAISFSSRQNDINDQQVSTIGNLKARIGEKNKRITQLEVQNLAKVQEALIDSDTNQKANLALIEVQKFKAKCDIVQKQLDQERNASKHVLERYEDTQNLLERHLNNSGMYKEKVEELEKDRGELQQEMIILRGMKTRQEDELKEMKDIIAKMEEEWRVKEEEFHATLLEMETGNEEVMADLREQNSAWSRKNQELVMSTNELQEKLQALQSVGTKEQSTLTDQQPGAATSSEHLDTESLEPMYAFSEKQSRNSASPKYCTLSKTPRVIEKDSIDEEIMEIACQRRSLPVSKQMDSKVQGDEPYENLKWISSGIISQLHKENALESKKVEIQEVQDERMGSGDLCDNKVVSEAGHSGEQVDDGSGPKKCKKGDEKGDFLHTVNDENAKTKAFRGDDDPDLVKIRSADGFVREDECERASRSSNATIRHEEKFKESVQGTLRVSQDQLTSIQDQITLIKESATATRDAVNGTQGLVSSIPATATQCLVTSVQDTAICHQDRIQLHQMTSTKVVDVVQSKSTDGFQSKNSIRNENTVRISETVHDGIYMKVNIGGIENIKQDGKPLIDSNEDNFQRTHATLQVPRMHSVYPRDGISKIREKEVHILDSVYKECLEDVGDNKGSFSINRSSKVDQKSKEMDKGTGESVLHLKNSSKLDDLYLGDGGNERSCDKEGHILKSDRQYLLTNTQMNDDKQFKDSMDAETVQGDRQKKDQIRGEYDFPFRPGPSAKVTPNTGVFCSDRRLSCVTIGDSMNTVDTTKSADFIAKPQKYIGTFLADKNKEVGFADQRILHSKDDLKIEGTCLNEKNYSSLPCCKTFDYNQVTQKKEDQHQVICGNKLVTYTSALTTPLQAEPINKKNLAGRPPHATCCVSPSVMYQQIQFHKSLFAGRPVDMLSKSLFISDKPQISTTLVSLPDTLVSLPDTRGSLTVTQVSLPATSPSTRITSPATRLSSPAKQVSSPATQVSSPATPIALLTKPSSLPCAPWFSPSTPSSVITFSGTSVNTLLDTKLQSVEKRGTVSTLQTVSSSPVNSAPNLNAKLSSTVIPLSSTMPSSTAIVSTSLPFITTREFSSSVACGTPPSSAFLSSESHSFLVTSLPLSADKSSHSSFSQTVKYGSKRLSHTTLSEKKVESPSKSPSNSTPENAPKTPTKRPCPSEDDELALFSDEEDDILLTPNLSHQIQKAEEVLWNSRLKRPKRNSNMPSFQNNF